MKRFFAIIFAVILCLTACSLTSCGGSGEKTVSTTKYVSVYSSSDITNMLLNTVGSSDTKGNDYAYFNVGTHETDEDSYYIFKWCIVKPANTTVTYDLVQYIFVSYDAKKAYKGYFNEESQQVTFNEKIDLGV